MDNEQELERVAQEYRDEGYAVVTRPGADHLPAFAAGFGVDLLATRGDERVLVQVKHDRSALEADPDVPMRAEITSTQPGWRYDLVILNASDPLRRLTRDAREPSDQEINEILGDVERMTEAGDLRPACVFAWAALEATLRRVAGNVEPYMPRTRPVELLRILYGNGTLSRESFDHLNRSFRLRTELVHGLVPPAIDLDLIRAVVRATRHLLNGNREPSSVAS